jgi:hypothetical protein
MNPIAMYMLIHFRAYSRKCLLLLEISLIMRHIVFFTYTIQHTLLKQMCTMQCLSFLLIFILVAERLHFILLFEQLFHVRKLFALTGFHLLLIALLIVNEEEISRSHCSLSLQDLDRHR